MGLLLLTGTPTGVQAQGGSTGDQVTVNYDILTNLDWAARVSAQAGLGNRRAGLLPPPDRAPESRVLIKPAPVASRAPEPRTPAPTETAEVGPDVTGQADEGTPPVPRTDAPMESPARVAPLVPQPPPPEPVAKSLSTPAPAHPPERAVAEPPAPAVPPAEPAAAPAPQPASPQPAAPQTAAPQTAALPPGGQASDLLAPGDLRLLFAADAFELSQAAKRELAALAGRLRPEGNPRIQRKEDHTSELN